MENYCQFQGPQYEEGLIPFLDRDGNHIRRQILSDLARLYAGRSERFFLKLIDDFYALEECALCTQGACVRGAFVEEKQGGIA